MVVSLFTSERVWKGNVVRDVARRLRRLGPRVLVVR